MISFQKEECDQGVVVPNCVVNLTGETVDMKPQKKKWVMTENRLWTQWERAGQVALKHTCHMCKIAGGKLLHHTGASARLCNDLEGWEGSLSGGYIYILWLIHVVVQQQPTHGQAIILQLKVNFKNCYTIPP